MIHVIVTSPPTFWTNRGNQMSKLNVFFCIEFDLLCSHNFGHKRTIVLSRISYVFINHGFMAYFCWTTRKDEQMHGLDKVILVMELLEWDIHDTSKPYLFRFREYEGQHNRSKYGKLHCKCSL
jgi:hypothetical protein